MRNAPSSASLDRADLLELGIGQDRLRDLEPLVGAGIVAEQVRARADHRDQAHHQLLADRIDRRVGDLREILLEIVVEQPRPVGQHGDAACRCPSTRSDRRRLAPSARGRTSGLPRCSRTPAGDTVSSVGIALGWLGVRRDGGQLLELELRLRAATRRRAASAASWALISSSSMMRPCSRSMSSIRPGWSRHLRTMLLLGDRQHAAFRGHDHPVVVGDAEARRPEAVAVERRADLPPVGERDRGRPVPRLHQRGMIFVEGAALRHPSRHCRPTPRGSASSSHAPGNSRRRSAARAHCRGRPCPTGRAG